ncbi:MAG: aldolase [Phycisphaerae bacterium]|nr:aldolase [Phycisphaerae bacterium]
MKGKTMSMRPSRVLRRMRAGETAVCYKTNLTDPRVVEIAGRIGFDCVWACMEHVPNSIHDVENQIRAGKMHDMDVMVRVRRGSYSDLILPLEMDASGIMVPHVMNLQEARKIVYYTKFHPVGRRPWDGGNSDGAYCMIPPEKYIEQANRERFVMIQIEDPEPMDDLEEIAKLDGIDAIFFGPGDFSQGVGLPGQYDHPNVREARKRVVDAARRHGKFAGTMASPETLPELSAMGFQFLNVGADVVALARGMADIARQLNQAGFALPNSMY